MVLSQNYPNPFNADTWIRYYIPSSQDIDLTIYDILGRNVIRLDYGYKDPGLYQVRWNGKNSKNETVSSGVYIYLLKNDNIIQRKRMILLK
ncbi:MAG TPA: T9SS type A sorting domain-containing protein [Candidatus Marinimicrobia bacterium]|nr:T9SS type A sorting domain-containing protein [Candidatus Neomarinimicrobiota bacterium]